MKRCGNKNRITETVDAILLVLSITNFDAKIWNENGYILKGECVFAINNYVDSLLRCNILYKSENIIKFKNVQYITFWQVSI